jgi:D-3-phosphoglycerate dehydrogenase
MIKIRIAEEKDFDIKVLNFLKQYAEVEIASCSVADLPHILNSYDVFWFRLGYKIDQALIANCKRVKVIATPVTGINHIDELACNKKGIQIACLRGEYQFLKEVRATAEHTMALTFALMRLIGPAINDTIQGKWSRDEFRGNELYQKKVGIVGLGRLGEITASYFKAFGCEVYYYDIRDVNSEFAQKVFSLKEIADCDIVSIHVDYTPVTHHLINEDFFRQCNPRMCFINTSRGGVVNEKALLNSLSKNKIKGAALDVVENEFEFNSQNELVKFAAANSNLILTPHIGGNTYESFEKTEMFIAKKVLHMFNIAN